MLNHRISNIITALAAVGVIYAVFFIVPPVEGLGEKVRIVFFHIPAAWISVMAFVLSALWALRYLNTHQIEYDRKSATAAGLGFFFCLLATISGALFAKITWGAYWNWDPRQTTIFILLLLYGASFALRTAIHDIDQRAKISSAYSLLSIVVMPFLVFVIPRYYSSLHPSPVINSAAKIAMDPVMLYTLIAALLVASALFRQLFIYYIERTRRRDLAQKDSPEGGGRL
ncbi:MAG: cytochrome c biogenesis protein [Phycisphaerales bacterium]